MLIKVDYSFHLFVARRILIQHWLVLLEQIIYLCVNFPFVELFPVSVPTTSIIYQQAFHSILIKFSKFYNNTRILNA